MFNTPAAELQALFSFPGQITIGDDFLKIEDYPFEPSIAFRQTIFSSIEIDDIDYQSAPPAIRVNNDLIFLTAEKKEELKIFATKNKIKTIERSPLWDWILEPFLDTEFTPETGQRLTGLLNDYGLNPDKVKSIREEVKTQMHKYNFDTMLWEWCNLNIWDVLSAMRLKYDKKAFADFYKSAISIALMTKSTGD